MKKIKAVVNKHFPVIVFASLLSLAALVYAATTKEMACQTVSDSSRLDRQSSKGYIASGTANVTAYSLGTLYGVAYSIEIVSTVDEAFTITISHTPKKEAGGEITWPVAVTKFTKVLSLTANTPVEYVFESTSANSNVGLGALFNGEMTVTIENFSSGIWYINVNTEKGFDPIVPWNN
jgi:hypothetical protein